jgi:hypothetical protein
MSLISLYQGQIRTAEGELGRLRAKRVDATKKVSQLKGDISRLEGNARRATSESMVRNYVRQIEG